MNSNSWIKVAEGAKLVATAMAEIATKDGTKVATTLGTHGSDVIKNTSHVSTVLVSALQQQLNVDTSKNWNVGRNKKEGVSTSTTTTNAMSTTTATNYLNQNADQTTISSQDIQMQSTNIHLDSSNNGSETSTMLNHQTTEASKSDSSECNDVNDDTNSISRQDIGMNMETNTNINVHSIQENMSPSSQDNSTFTEPQPISPPTSKSISTSHNHPQPLPPPSSQHSQHAQSQDDTTNLQLLEEGRAVPSTRIGRAFGFASLAVGLAAGTTVELASRLITPKSSSSSSSNSSIVANDANADRLAKALCRMRGAALKMGQMLSIQDENILPTPLARALEQVRQGAEAMPLYQLHQLLERELGSEWRSRFEEFTELPFAAASIGQVHLASIPVEVMDDCTSSTSSTGESTSSAVDGDGSRKVVVKVQYPSVADSIESDLNNLSMLVTMTGLAPKGLFIEEIIRVGREELIVECDYLREMRNQKRMRELVLNDAELTQARFVVPDVIEDRTTARILTSEYCPGSTIDKVLHLDQEERNRVARNILRLTMKELFVWRFMQTDPNWGNFLYDMGTGTTSLIDFGSARDFDKSFVDGYLRIVWSAANQDTETLMKQSQIMGFLTGEENETMLTAHKMSGFTIGEPFATDEVYDFETSKITARISDYGAAFLQHRLTAPPEEVYTLHRKLAGAYNLCIKLKAKIKCRDLLEEVMVDYSFDDGQEHPYSKVTSNTATSR